MAVNQISNMKKNHPTIHQIEIRIAEVPQLFNSMDPTPFHHRDLDIDAERFLESWALEFPQDSHFRIIVHIEQMTPEDPTELVERAIQNHFEYKAILARRNLNLLLVEGRTSMLIGLGFLGLCLLGADLLSVFSNNTFLKILKESLLIGGWVAMWRPMQMVLYDWWPIVRRIKIYQNLSHAIVQVKPAQP